MKMTKRFLSMAIVLTILATLFTGVNVTAAREPFEHDFFEDGWMTRDGAEEYVMEVDLGGEHGKAIKILPSYTTRYISSTAFAQEQIDKKLHFSFEFMYDGDTSYFGNLYVKDGRPAPFTKEEITSGWNKPNFTTTTDFGFSHYQNEWNLSTNKVSGAEFGKWYQIDSIYDLENAKIKYYVDGQYIGEGDYTQDQAENRLNAIVICASCFNHQTGGISGSENMITGGTYYFDNMVIHELGENITAKYDSAKSSDAVAAVKFSEPLNSTSGIKLVDVETQTEASTSVTKLDELTYGFALDGLKAGAEYKVVVPAGISGVYGNTTKVSEVYFNAADEAVVTGRGGEVLVPETERFDDDLESYGEIAEANIVETTLEADGVNRWALLPNGAAHFQIKNVNGSNALYTDMSTGTANYDDNAMARNNVPDGGTEWINSGVTDIYFDIALGNPVANDSIARAANNTAAAKSWVYVGLPNNNWTGNIQGFYSLFRIDGTGTISKYKPGFEWNGDCNFKDDRNISTVDKYKMTVDYDNSLISVAKYNSSTSVYDEFYSTAIDATKMGADGFRGIEFRPGRTTSVSNLAEGTGVFVDNVRVVEREKVSAFEFEDDFSSYQVTGNAGENKLTTVSNPKWSLTASGGTWWGRGVSAASVNGNSVMRIDNWQDKGAVATRLASIMSGDAINEGIVEYTFDAGVQNPTANGDNEVSFIMGFDVVGSSAEPARNYPFPALTVTNRGTIKYYSNCDYGSEQTVSGYTDANNLSVNSYKLVADFYQGKVFSYILDNGSYVKIGEATMHADMKSYGVKNIAFELSKTATDAVLAADTSAAVDNVKIDALEQYIAPVVKSVRIDGAAASDAVAVDSRQIKIFFNKAMDSSTLGAITVGGVNYGGTYSDADYSYTINLTGELAPLTSYTIDVPATACDADGNGILRAYSGKFKTAKGIFKVTSFYLNEGETEATLANTQAGDTLTAGVTIRNGAEDTGSYVLMYAVYDGDKMVNMDYVPVDFSAAEAETAQTINITVPQTTGTLGIKAMLWDGFEKMVPVMPAIVLD